MGEGIGESKMTIGNSAVPDRSSPFQSMIMVSKYQECLSSRIKLRLCSVLN